jgi:hypothetical protein
MEVFERGRACYRSVVEMMRFEMGQACYKSVTRVLKENLEAGRVTQVQVFEVGGRALGGEEPRESRLESLHPGRPWGKGSNELVCASYT